VPPLRSQLTDRRHQMRPHREANAHRLRTPRGETSTSGAEQQSNPAPATCKKIINRFSRRGLDNATGELHLAATAFNLMKVHKAAQVA